MATTRRPAGTRRTTPRSSRVEVRVATPKDLDAVVALRLELLHEEKRSPLFARPRRDLPSKVADLTAQQLSAEGEVTLLAVIGAEAVGILRATCSRGTRLVHPVRYGFLTSAYVRPEHRRQGVLRRLLTSAEAWCRDQGLTEVRLHCTLENLDGNQAWEALGYAPAELVRRRVLSSQPSVAE